MGKGIEKVKNFFKDPENAALIGNSIMAGLLFAGGVWVGYELGHDAGLREGLSKGVEHGYNAFIYNMIEKSGLSDSVWKEGHGVDWQITYPPYAESFPNADLMDQDTLSNILDHGFTMVDDTVVVYLSAKTSDH